MSTVSEFYATQIQLVRKVRFDCVNEFDSEVPWLPSTTTPSNRGFCFRARVGIDTGLNSSILFNMIAHITRKPNEDTVCFRFFRPPHSSGVKKLTQTGFELARDGFSRLSLQMTFLAPDGKEVFNRSFSSTMNTCGVDCTCLTDPRQPCHTLETFCSSESIFKAMSTSTLNSGVQFAHIYAIFDIRMEGRMKPSFWSCCYLQKPALMDSLSMALKSVLEDSTLHDVILRVSGEEFKAHMNILAGHSDVFAAMFECDMKEKNSRVVEINDMVPSTVGVLLKYLYYRELKDIADNPQVAVDLLRAADKYNIQDLQITCENILRASTPERFTVDSALDCYLCGNRLGIQKIEVHAVAVLKSKGNEIRESESFRKFVESNLDAVPNLFYLLTTVEKVEYPC